ESIADVGRQISERSDFGELDTPGAVQERDGKGDPDNPYTRVLHGEAPPRRHFSRQTLVPDLSRACSLPGLDTAVRAPRIGSADFLNVPDSTAFRAGVKDFCCERTEGRAKRLMNTGQGYSAARRRSKRNDRSEA